MTWQITAIISAIVTFLICLGLHELDINRIESDNDKAIATQVTFDIKKCEAEKQITKGANDDLQSENSTLKSQLDTAKLRVGTRCIMPVTKPAGLSKPGSTPAKLPTPDAGITASALLDFAGSCEQTRFYLLNLRQFNSQVWKNN